MKFLGALRDLSSNIGRIGHDASVNTALMVESIYRQRLSDHKNEFAKSMPENTSRRRMKMASPWKYLIEFAQGGLNAASTL
jgi:hypothetical protein